MEEGRMGRRKGGEERDTSGMNEKGEERDRGGKS